MTSETIEPDIGPSVIGLELTDEMQDKQFVTELSYSFGSDSLIFKFNHTYNKTIEVYPIIEEKDWSDMLDTVVDTLKEKGVDEEHCKMLRRVISKNSDNIMNHYAAHKKARATEGVKARMERIERLENGTPVDLSIKDVLRRHEGNVRVRGMINGLGIVEKMYKAVGFRCQDCYGVNKVIDYRGLRPRFLDEIPRIDISRKRCHRGCQKEYDFVVDGPLAHEPWDDPVSSLKIVTFDAETFDDMESLNIVLLGDYTRGVRTGEQVIVSGSIQSVRKQSYLFVGLNSKIDGFEYVNKKRSVDLTEDIEKKVREFIAENKGKEWEAVAMKMAPSIIGQEHVKKGLLLSYINSGKDSTSMRRRLNCLLIGDPGLAKTKLIKYMVRLGGGNSTFASAADSSAKSLVAVIDGEERILRIGAIPRAHGAICAIDEVGRMSPDDQGYLLSGMEEGLIFFARFGWNINLPASDTFILSANPAGTSGKFKDAIKVLNADYNLIGQVRDRVDFFFVIRKNTDSNSEMNYAYEKLTLEENIDNILKQEDSNIEFLQQIYSVSQRYNPTISTEARHMLMKYYADAVVAADSPFSRRLLESLKNACYALARLKLKNVVDAEDAKEIIEFFKIQVSAHQKQVVNTPNDQPLALAEKIIDWLKGQTYGFDWLDILRNVCKEDKWLSEYVKKNGKEDWNINNNKKIRKIRDKLEILQSYKDKILILNERPLTIAWGDSYLGDKTKAIDINNVIEEGLDKDTTGGDQGQGTKVTKVTKVTYDDIHEGMSSESSDLQKDRGHIEVTKIPHENGSRDLSDLCDPSNDPIPDPRPQPQSQPDVKSISKEQQLDIAGQIFDSLLSSNIDQIGVEKEVLESGFIEALTASGFDNVDKLINDMVRDGFLEKVITEKDGVLYDMLRKVVLVGATR